MSDRVEIFKDNAGEWRWRLKARNGEVIGVSGEGYKNRQHCADMVNSMWERFAAAEIAFERSDVEFEEGQGHD